MKNHDSNPTSLPALVIAVGLILLPPSLARGASVLWTDYDWPSPTRVPVTEHVVAGVEGGDVSWDFGGNTETLTSLGNSATLTGGLRAGESLGVRWAPETVDEQITLDIDFSHPYGVTNVSMRFFDIDRDHNRSSNSRWGDQVVITATTTTGAIIYPTFSGLGDDVGMVAPGTLIGLGDVSSSSSDGNATITFVGDIASIRVVFSDQGVGRFRDEELHEVGIDGVTFVPVLAPIPEPDPRALLVLAPLIFLLVRRRRLSRFRR